MSEFAEQEEYCLNCKTTLQGDYCHRCGQKKLNEHNDSFLHMMIHFIGDFVHFDSQIFRTAIPLLVKPGFLVNEYLKGKRARYLPPVRMYVFLSFLFFFLTFSLTNVTKNVKEDVTDDSVLKFNVKDDSTKEIKNLPFSELSDTLKKMDNNFITFGNEKYASARQYDSLQGLLKNNQKDFWLIHQFKLKVLIIKGKILSNDRNEFINEMIDNFLHNFPKILFFLLPVFAFLLKLLYRKRYYLEHLIFSITFYNFFFLFGSLMLLIRLIPVFKDTGDFLYAIIPLLYLFLSMKNVYQEKKRKTMIKFIFFIVSFSVLLGFGLVANVLFTIFSA